MGKYLPYFYAKSKKFLSGCFFVLGRGLYHVALMSVFALFFILKMNRKKDFEKNQGVVLLFLKEHLRG